MNLVALNPMLKTFGGLCVVLAGSLVAFAPNVAVALSLLSVLIAAFISSPLANPADGSSRFHKVCATVAAVLGAATASSYFPQVQNLISTTNPHAAHIIGVVVGVVAAVFAYLAQSPLASKGAAPTKT